MWQGSLPPSARRSSAFDTIGSGHLNLAAPALTGHGSYVATVPSAQVIAAAIAVR